MDIEDLRLLQLTAKLGSFTRAAEAAGIAKSVLSRRIRMLEEDLDSRLLHRTTRQVKLTEAGEKALESCSQILEQYDSLKQQLGKGRTLPTGKLRIAAPLGFERYFLRDLVTQYLREYPELDFQLMSTNQSLEMLYSEMADIAIHFGNPPDSSYIARKLGEVKVDYFASREYLAEKGVPKSIDDLQNHNCILEQYSENTSKQWLFPENGGLRTFLPNDRYSSNTTELCLHLATEGFGIAWLPEFFCRQELDSRKLVRVFDGGYSYESPVYALYASRQFLPIKIKTFIDKMIGSFPRHQ
jgi:DNA-binding transcriptional LysR family regulator